MNIVKLLGQSLRSISSNKVRSSLTVLGIVIGIAAVIALVGLGKGLQANVTSRISNLGTTRITIRSQNPERQTAQRQRGFSPGGGGGGFNFGGNTETLTPDDYAAIKKTANIVSASPDVSAQADVALTADADQATQYQISGIDASYFDMQKYQLESGSNLTQAQVDAKENDVVIGAQAAKDIFSTSTPGGQVAVGQTIYLKNTPFKVVGVLKAPAEAASFNNPADNLYIGYQSWLALNDKSKLNSVVAEASSDASVDSAAAAIKSLLLKNHAIADANKADVGVSTSKDLLNTVNNVTGTFTSTLAGIAAISLVVGGIGIMNIMLVTVTERTREIGLRRAVGAKTRHILWQFLIESLLLTMIGGGLGLLAGIGFSQKSASLLRFAPGGRGMNSSQIHAVVDWQTVILAVVISAVIGVVFGLFPAIKAAKLDPVDALRYE